MNEFGQEKTMNEFEKWWNTYDKGSMACFDECNDAFRAGAAAMKEQCAEVADKMTRECPSPNCSEYTDMDDCLCKETGFCITNAIRGMEI